jgi:hypothetical protein
LPTKKIIVKLQRGAYIIGVLSCVLGAVSLIAGLVTILIGVGVPNVFGALPMIVYGVLTVMAARGEKPGLLLSA